MGDRCSDAENETGDVSAAADNGTNPIGTLAK